MTARRLEPRRRAPPRDDEAPATGLADAVSHPLWIAGADGAPVFANAGLRDYCGLGASRLRQTWRELFPPEDLDAYLALFLRDARPGEARCRLRAADGGLRWHALVSRRLAGAHGRALWCVTATDVHRLHAVEQQLEHARRALDSLLAAKSRMQEMHAGQLREFLDRMPGIAWIKDAAFRYTWVSRSFARIHQIAARGVLGRTSLDVWGLPFGLECMKEDRRVVRARSPVQSVQSVPIADGETVRMQVLKLPLLDGSGAPGIVGIAFEQAAAPDRQARRELEVTGILSARERQVLQLAADGHTSREIAALLHISPKSAETYRRRLMDKLGLPSQAALVKYALRNHFTTPR